MHKHINENADEYVWSGRITPVHETYLTNFPRKIIPGERLVWNEERIIKNIYIVTATTGTISLVYVEDTSWYQPQTFYLKLMISSVVPVQGGDMNQGILLLPYTLMKSLPFGLNIEIIKVYGLKVVLSH